MFKGFTILFNLLGLFLCRLFFPVSVNVNQSVPPSAEINNSFTVQVAINKADIKGLGKFTEQLPLGFKATPIDREGANVIVDSRSIVFSWDSLPDDGIVNISFRINIEASAVAGTDTLLGRFLYTSSNQKLEADCTPSVIAVTGGPAVVASNNAPQQSNDIKTSSDRIFVVRQSSSTSIAPGTDANITLVIHKANVKGFAKIEDSIPPGYTATAQNTSGASFTFVDNMAKFVWGNIPSDSLITVSYKIRAGSETSGTHSISGNFSCIYNNEPISYSVASTVFNTVPPVNNTTTPQNTQQSLPVNTLSSTTVNNVAPVENTTPSAPTAAASITPSIPNPQTGINYRVQIMALHNPVDVSYFSSKKKIKTPVNTELAGGFTKYTVGNYTDYKLVRDAREDLINRGINGAFVVSYNSGTRITVQEALMISHQQWYK